MILISNPDKSQWQEILKRPVMNTENLFDTVRSVIDRVKEEGDPAVLTAMPSTTFSPDSRTV